MSRSKSYERREWREGDLTITQETTREVTTTKTVEVVPDEAERSMITVEAEGSFGRVSGSFPHPFMRRKP